MNIAFSACLVSRADIQTLTPPTQLGRLTHYAFDAVLLSAFLAGVKRSTGLTYVPIHSTNPSHLNNTLPYKYLSFHYLSKADQTDTQPQLQTGHANGIERTEELGGEISRRGRMGHGSECGDYGE